MNGSAGPEALRAMGLIDGKARAPSCSRRRARSSPGIGGVYLTDNDIVPLDDEQRPLTAESVPTAATSSSIDPADAQRLWELSERLLDA